MAAMGQRGYKFTIPEEEHMINIDLYWLDENYENYCNRVDSWFLAQEIVEGIEQFRH